MAIKANMEKINIFGLTDQQLQDSTLFNFGAAVVESPYGISRLVGQIQNIRELDQSSAPRFGTSGFNKNLSWRERLMNVVQSTITESAAGSTTSIKVDNPGIFIPNYSVVAPVDANHRRQESRYMVTAVDESTKTLTVQLVSVGTPVDLQPGWKLIVSSESHGDKDIFPENRISGSWEQVNQVQRFSKRFAITRDQLNAHDGYMVMADGTELPRGFDWGTLPMDDYMRNVVLHPIYLDNIQSANLQLAAEYGDAIVNGINYANHSKGLITMARTAHLDSGGQNKAAGLTPITIDCNNQMDITHLNESTALTSQRGSSNSNRIFATNIDNLRRLMDAQGSENIYSSISTTNMLDASGSAMPGVKQINELRTLSWSDETSQQAIKVVADEAITGETAITFRPDNLKFCFLSPPKIEWQKISGTQNIEFTLNFSGTLFARNTLFEVTEYKNILS